MLRLVLLQERFQPADLAEIGAAAGGEAEGCRPALMSGLYLRFDTGGWLQPDCDHEAGRKEGRAACKRRR